MRSSVFDVWRVFSEYREEIVLIVVAQCDLNCPANFIVKSFPTCLLLRMSIPTATLAKLTNKGRSEPVRIRVIDKQPKQSSSTKVSYQRMVFSDREGTKLTCTLFGLDIDVYEEILIRGNYYDIKNMIVKDVPPPRFASYDGEKQLYFTNSTSVFPVIVAGESSKKVSQYTIIRDVTAISSTDERFDMILLVLKMHPEKMVPIGASLLPVREMSVTDSSGEEILIVSAWNQRMIEKFNQIEPVLLEDPVVDLRGLKISKYSGFSLATSLSTEVKLRPTCDEATALRDWIKSNPAVVRSRTMRSLHTEAPVHPTETTAIATSLSMQAETVTESHLLRIRVHIPDIKYDSIRISVGCRACGKACLRDNVRLQDDYQCDICSIVKKPEPKLYFRFKCTDGTATLTLDAYTKSAERLLRVKCEEFHAKSEQERRDILTAAEARYRASTVDLVIGPAPPLLIINKRLKWILKDIAI